MQGVLIIWCFICKVSLLFGALYARCLCYLVLYMQGVLIIWCFICKVSLLFGALYARCLCYLVLYMQGGPCYLVLYMQSVLIIWCFIYKVSLLFGALYAKYTMHPVGYMLSSGGNRASSGSGQAAPMLCSCGLSDSNRSTESSSSSRRSRVAWAVARSRVRSLRCLTSPGTALLLSTDNSDANCSSGPPRQTISNTSMFKFSTKASHEDEGVKHVV